MTTGGDSAVPGATVFGPQVRRVLVMKWSAMGDVALASTVMQDLAEALPGVTLDLDTSPRFAGLFRHDRRFGEVLGIDVRASRVAGTWQWLTRVARGRYDAVVDFQSNDRSRLLLGALTLSGLAPPIRVGNFARWPYTVGAPPQPTEVHALDHLRATLRACGVPTPTRTPVLTAGPDNERRVAELVARHRLRAGRYALFMPGCQAAGRLKRWGWRRFAALAVELSRRGVDRVVLVGADDEREECDAIAAACPDITVNLCGETAILDLIPLARHARCVVANDTGTGHVAAVADRPMAVVCGPTDPRRVRPAGPRVVTRQAPLYCVNCYRKACTHHACMEVLHPQQVLEALASVGAFDDGG